MNPSLTILAVGCLSMAVVVRAEETGCVAGLTPAGDFAVPMLVAGMAHDVTPIAIGVFDSGESEAEGVSETGNFTTGLSWSLSDTPDDLSLRWGSLTRVMAANLGLARRSEELLSEWTAQDSARRDSGPTDLIEAATRAAFPEPAVFRWGSHQIGGGLVNAIQWRNPLYLFNQVFLSVSF